MRASRWSSALVALALLGACRASREDPRPGAALPLPARLKGANLRPVGDPSRGYGTPTATKTMRRLVGMGVNCLTFIVEARLDDLEDAEVRGPSRAELARLQRGLLDAHAMGLPTIVVPHLYLDDGEWRGRLAYDGAPEEAREFWRTFTAMMVDVAEVAERGSASMLAIGIELKALSAREESIAEVARLSSEVRRVFSGKLTYAANWDEAEDVRFWPLLDFIGVNGYYPLEPDPVRGAEAVARRLSALGGRFGREVVILEVGYRASPGSHERPWEWPEDVDPTVDEAGQARVWAAVLASWLSAEGVRGLSFWVVPTDPDDPASEPRHGFSPMNRAAEGVLRRAFVGEGGAS